MRRYVTPSTSPQLLQAVEPLLQQIVSNKGQARRRDEAYHFHKIAGAVLWPICSANLRQISPKFRHFLKIFKTHFTASGLLPKGNGAFAEEEKEEIKIRRRKNLSQHITAPRYPAERVFDEVSASDLRRAGVPALWLAEHALVRAGERRQELGQCVCQMSRLHSDKRSPKCDCEKRRFEVKRRM